MRRRTDPLLAPANRPLVSAGAEAFLVVFPSGTGARPGSQGRRLRRRVLEIPTRRDWTLRALLLFGGGLFCLVWALIGANRIGWSTEMTREKLCPWRPLINLTLFVVAELIQRRPSLDPASRSFWRTFLGAGSRHARLRLHAQVMMTYLPLYRRTCLA